LLHWNCARSAGARIASTDHYRAQRALTRSRPRRHSRRIVYPTKLPPPNEMGTDEEPVITAMMHPRRRESVGAILQLCVKKPAGQKNFEYLSPARVGHYDLPLNEIVLDLSIPLEEASRGDASLTHRRLFGSRSLVSLDVLVGGEPVDALALVCHREFSSTGGRELVTRLANDSRGQMFSKFRSICYWEPRDRARDSRGDPQERASPSATAATSRGTRRYGKNKRRKKRMKRVGRVDPSHRRLSSRWLKVASTSDE